jgi:hypothetical protein
MWDARRMQEGHSVGPSGDCSRRRREIFHPVHIVVLFIHVHLVLYLFPSFLVFLVEVVIS